MNIVIIGKHKNIMLTIFNTIVLIYKKISNKRKLLIIDFISSFAAINLI